MKKLLLTMGAIVALASGASADDLEDYGRSSKSLFQKSSLPYTNTVYDNGAEIILSDGEILRAYNYKSGEKLHIESQFIVSHDELIWQCTYDYLNNMYCKRTSYEPMFEIREK